MPTPSEHIDELIAGTPDFRGELVARIRKIAHEADPDITEEWKWMGSPVFSHGGIVCVVTVLKDKVKLTFNDGASLADPDRVFNAGLGGNKWRAVDMGRGYQLNETGLKALIRAGADYNLAKPARTRKK